VVTQGPVKIEDYALIGDTQTAGLVSTAGSIDWLCLPRFDSAACFAALLGDQHDGRWLLTPSGTITRQQRRYRPGTLVLETELETADGAVRIVDCMPIRDRTPDVVRLVQGLRGRVPVHMELILRFGYGYVVPWVRQVDGRLRATAGPDSVELVTPVETRGEDFRTLADFTVAAGDTVPFLLRWHPSHEAPPPPIDADAAVADTDAWWTEWSGRAKLRLDEDRWRDTVLRSVITLKALTYAPTGGIVAAATTSLPEKIGGVRNWDYRYCWLRDATFTLYSLMLAGYVEEATAWRDWLLRAVAGEPSKLQIMYGPAGERRLDEFELPHLAGYEGSRPVRIGNAASGQFQLDVYGEVMDAMHQARRAGMTDDGGFGWAFQCALMDFLETAWAEPDEGIWEVRGPRRHFTHSKVMAWVAVDRAVRATERFDCSGPVDRWRQLREQIHAEVCAKGFDTDRDTFTQYYGSTGTDASLLMMPLVGFLPASDPRVQGTVAAVQRELTTPEGFVMRYIGDSSEVDGLPPGEGCFLACTFWLADNLMLAGRLDEAKALFERLLALTNDVGLLSEEYDPVGQRLLGNFPQAFSHVSLVNTAHNLTRGTHTAAHRADGVASGR
jgi:GH15 family glucan-1,4-alpha-glucosidase